MDLRKADIHITRVENGQASETDDALAVEEPLEISMMYGPADRRTTQKVSITMRTPGNDAELAAGFLFTEGIIRHRDEISDIRHQQTLPGMESNYMLVSLKEHVTFDREKLERNFYTTSSCGVCGKGSLTAIRTVVPDYGATSSLPAIDAKLICSLPDIMRKAQDTFESTGGLHASGLFDLNGHLVALREDVGRHNALDKLIGRALLDDQVPLSKHILLLSGRASFELLQKSAMAGIKIICAVGAPSSLAVECAREFNICLIGFLRGNRFNVYHRGEVELDGILNDQG